MTVRVVSGDPQLTRADFLAFGHNARGRLETTALEAALRRAYPAAFASYQKQCRQGRIVAGGYWAWRESRPRLLFMVVRESSVGATRLRHVQSVLFRLARDYRLEGIRSVAIAPLGSPHEWREAQRLVRSALGNSRLDVVLYTAYQPGVSAEANPENDEA